MFVAVTSTLKKTQVLSLAAILFRTGNAEEEYVWEDAIVLDNAPFGLISWLAPLDDLIHGSIFKDIIATNSANANQFFTIDQGESLKITRLYL